MPSGTQQMTEIRKSDGYKTLSSGGHDGEIETPFLLKETQMKIFLKMYCNQKSSQADLACGMQACDLVQRINRSEKELWVEMIK